MTMCVCVCVCCISSIPGQVGAVWEVAALDTGPPLEDLCQPTCSKTLKKTLIVAAQWDMILSCTVLTVLFFLSSSAAADTGQ